MEHTRHQRLVRDTFRAAVAHPPCARFTRIYPIGELPGDSYIVVRLKTCLHGDQLIIVTGSSRARILDRDPSSDRPPSRRRLRPPVASLLSYDLGINKAPDPW